MLLICTAHICAMEYKYHKADATSNLGKIDVFGVGLSSLEGSKVTASPNMVPAISHMYIV